MRNISKIIGQDSPECQCLLRPRKAKELLQIKGDEWYLKAICNSRLDSVLEGKNATKPLLAQLKKIKTLTTD